VLPKQRVMRATFCIVCELKEEIEKSSSEWDDAAIKLRICFAMQEVTNGNKEKVLHGRKII
jgi:hypothetical protein